MEHRSLKKSFLDEGQEIAKWLLSPLTTARLAAIFDEDSAADYGDELALLIDRIALLQKASR